MLRVLDRAIPAMKTAVGVVGDGSADVEAFALLLLAADSAPGFFRAPRFHRFAFSPGRTRKHPESILLFTPLLVLPALIALVHFGNSPFRISRSACPQS